MLKNVVRFDRLHMSQVAMPVLLDFISSVNITFVLCVLVRQ